jgi:hypothetical protein
LVQISREKQYMAANIFLKFSELASLPKSTHPFSGNYGATAEALLTEFYSPEEILEMPSDELVGFLMAKSRCRIAEPAKTTEILKRAARDSRKLDKTLYELLNTAIASSFNCISAFEKEIKAVSAAIEKLVVPECQDFYQKKFAEVKTHQNKRALALTARKLVRLIYGLLAKDQLCSPNKVGETS